MIDTTLQGPRGRGGVAGGRRLEAGVVAQQAGERGRDLPFGLIVARGGGGQHRKKTAGLDSEGLAVT